VVRLFTCVFTKFLCIVDLNANNIPPLPETEHDAEEMARAYVRRLAKWHGNDKKLEVCGYDLTQSQLFQDDNADNDNSEDSNCDSNTRSGRSFR